jgi:8-oxo-dGTP diphosphatase
MTSNEDEVHERLAGLFDRYGDAPVDREDPPFEVPPDRFRSLAERARTATLDSAYVWVRRTPEQFPTASMSEEGAATSPRVLFIYDRADDHEWTVPGGGREPGESLEEATHRELAEETGIEASITGLRRVRHMVAAPSEPVPGEEFETVHALHPVFEAEYEGGELTIQATELYGAGWFDRVPEPAHDRIAGLSITSR